MKWMLIVFALNSSTNHLEQFTTSQWESESRCTEVGSIIKRDLKSKLRYQEVTVVCQYNHDDGESGHVVREKEATCMSPSQRWIEQLKVSLNNPQSRRIFLQIISDDYDDNGDVEAFCRALDTVKASVQEIAPDRASQPSTCPAHG